MLLGVEKLVYVGFVFGEDLPHRLMEDDVYNGMFIPKGSLVSALFQIHLVLPSRLLTYLL